MKSRLENCRAQQQFWDAFAAEYQSKAAIRTDDFHYGPLLAGEKALSLFTDELPKQGRALELGCGAAQNSLWLTRQNWQCLAVDISYSQLKQAEWLASEIGVSCEWAPPTGGITDFRRQEPDAGKPLQTAGTWSQKPLMASPSSDRAEHASKLILMQAPLETLTAKQLNRTFELIHSVHALQFVEAPFRILRLMSRQLTPGGRLVIAVQHPLFAGEWLDLEGDGFGLFLKHYFRPQVDWRKAPDGNHIGSRSWPVSAWVSAIREMGMTLETLLEPPALPRRFLGDSPYPGGRNWTARYAQLRRMPSTLILVARKPKRGA